MSLIIKFFNSILDKKSSHDIQIKSLDGLRGIAVLFVLLGHSGNLTSQFSFNGSAKYGVFLFFSLSAFLLSLPFFYKKDNELKKVWTWARYFIRRFLRIYPLYTIVLFFHFLFPFVYFGVSFIPISLKELVMHLFLLDGKDVFWAIPVEFKYYLLLPFVIFIIVFILRRNIYFSFFFIIIFIFIKEYYAPSSTIILDSIHLFDYISIFLLGSFLALVTSKAQSIQFSKHARYFFELLSFILFSIVLLLIPDVWNFFKLGGLLILNPYYFYNHIILFGCLWALFIVSYMVGNGYMKKMLSSSILRVIGIVSFSLYLWHLLIYRALDSLIFSHYTFIGPVRVFILILVSLIFSIFSYVLIEKPFLSIRFK